MRFVTLAWIALLAPALTACKKPAPGAACKNEGEAVCKDKAAILTCKDGKWDEASCRGPDGCVKGGALVRCDESAAQDGDPCGSEGERYSCSVDKKSELRCDKGKWKVVGKCGGPGGCEAKYPVVKCDSSIASAGDPCARDKDAACSADGKAILECKNGKFVQTESCPGNCKVDALLVRCQ
jgi:hypothetical protein